MATGEGLPEWNAQFSPKKVDLAGRDTMSPPPSFEEGTGLRGSGGVSSPKNSRAPQVFGDNILECFHHLMKMIFAEDMDLAAFYMDITVFGTITTPVRCILRELSDWAFSTLDRQFEQILSPPKILPVAAAAASIAQSHRHLDPSSLRIFCFHLRCCTALIYMLEFDLNFMMQKTQTIVKMLLDLCCPGAHQSPLSPQILRHDIWITRPKDEINPTIPAILSILEVFIDELLVHQNLRKHFAAIYHVYDAAPDTIACSIGVIMECLCSHFLLSSHDEGSSIQFFQPPFLPNDKEEEPETGQRLSLPAVVVLMGMIPARSAPRLLQSHIILMVSRCVISSKDHSRRAADCYLGAFEQSVVLYTSLFQKSNKDFALGFDLCVRQSTRNLVNSHIKKLISKPEMVSSCVECIARSRDIVMEPWREEACLILGSFLQRVEKSQPSVKDDVIERLDGQEGCLVGALLKLMGSSLLRIVGLLRGKSYGGEREFVWSIMGCFGSCSSLGQYFLSPELERWSTSSKRRMLAHLSSLLLCSVERGLYPIWEGCIFAIMAVMNFLVLEEGNLDTPRGLFQLPFSLSRIPQERSRRSSLAIASNLQKLQVLYVKKGAKCMPRESDREICNGAEFLRCVVKGEPLPDWDDLADFIEAKPGKDYGQWLQNRKRYNRWKRKKSFVSSRERKLTLWKLLAG